MSKPEFLTIPEAAKLLGVSRRTAYLYVQSGRIPSQKDGLGRQGLKVKRADVEAAQQNAQQQ